MKMLLKEQKRFNLKRTKYLKAKFISLFLCLKIRQKPVNVKKY